MYKVCVPQIAFFVILNKCNSLIFVAFDDTILSNFMWIKKFKMFRWIFGGTIFKIKTVYLYSLEIND